MNNLNLKYFIRENDQYKEFKEYNSSFIGEDGVYARQLCQYLIIGGNRYKLIWNEMIDGEDVVILENEGKSTFFEDEKVNIFEDKNILEFRPYNHNKADNMPLATYIWLSGQNEVIRYLLKNAVEIEGLGQRNVHSFEINEDRKAYVIYFEPTDEDIMHFGLN
ncbi:RNA helicase [Bacillus cereus]|uniref:RNA helicase n=1 Tax=Bacillus cereus TaxID=1396 RepID=UPI003079B9B2